MNLSIRSIRKKRAMILSSTIVLLLKNRASQCWWPTTTNATFGSSGVLPRPALLTSQRATTAVESLAPCEFAKTNAKICSVHEDHTDNGHRESFSPILYLSTNSSSLGVALFVYLAGGIAYNRIVHHARGLKQIPNYHSWVEAFDFIKVTWMCV